MMSGLAFVFGRILQIITTIPIWGMLAYFVDRYVKANTLTPKELLCLFIVAVIATAWALVTFWQFHSYGESSLLTAAVDVAFVGGFIASVVLLRGIHNADCTSANLPAGSFGVSVNGHGGGASWGSGRGGVSIKKECTMIKASWVLGIINCILFAATAFFAYSLYRRGGTRTTTKTYDNGTYHRHRRTRRHHYV